MGEFRVFPASTAAEAHFPKKKIFTDRIYFSVLSYLNREFTMMVTRLLAVGFESGPHCQYDQCIGFKSGAAQHHT